MSLNPLNPAAGDVPVPEDRREVDAALRAGRITLRIFPYVDWRYGERGKKFTKSDSAWLAWLVRYDPARVNEQILWLRSVLSNRGMPGWILEIHLRSLDRQLGRTVPEKRAAYQKLAAAAQLLGSQRREMLSDEVWNRLALGLYVIEGSTLGGASIVPSLAEHLNFSRSRAVRFFRGYGDLTISRWRKVCQFIETNCGRRDRSSDTVDMAIQVFAAVNEWMSDVWGSKTAVDAFCP